MSVERETASEDDLKGSVERNSVSRTVSDRRLSMSRYFAAVSVAGRQLLQFASLIVLSRYLAPNEIGLAAIAATVTSFVAIFLEAGLSPGLVRLRQVSPSKIASVLWVNIGIAFTFGGLLLASGQLIEKALSSPGLSGLTVFTALCCFFSLQSVPLAMLERQFAFGKLASVELASTLFGLVVSVVFAARGFGAASVLLGQLTGVLTLTIGLWTVARARPSLRTTKAELVDTLRFCTPLAGFNFVNFWSRNLDTLMLARFTSTTTVGLYSRSYQFMLMPVQIIATVLARVLLPELGRHQGNDRLQRSKWLVAVRTGLSFGLPLAVLLVAGGSGLTTLLLGSSWQESGIFLSILALAIPPQVIGRLVGPWYQVHGDTRRQLVSGLINTVIMVAAILFFARLGGVPLAVAVTIAFWLQLSVLLTDLKIHYGIGPVLILRECGAVAPVGIGCMGMAAISLLLIDQDLPRLGVSLLLAIGCFASSFVGRGARRRLPLVNRKSEES